MYDEEVWWVVTDGMSEENIALPQEFAFQLRQIGADVAIVNNITEIGVRVAVIDRGIDYNNPTLLKSPFYEDTIELFQNRI
ncbi:MAG: hypothetical protein ACUVQ5_03445 [Candidatus Methanomethylicaceae archaeon]